MSTRLSKMKMASPIRNYRGRFLKKKEITVKRCKKVKCHVDFEHSYYDSHVADAESRTDFSKGTNSWQTGRRIVELGVLLSNLQHCKMCRLGPVPLTIFSVVGELKKGLSGCLYVKCQNIDCEYINCVAYGKTHRQKKRGMPCSAVNTKLGLAMIDSVGGANRTNNFLSTMNIRSISNPSLKNMERRAGKTVEEVAKISCATAAKETFQKEMEDVAQQESYEVQTTMPDFVPDLGVSSFPDSSPHLKLLLQKETDVNNNDWIDAADDDNEPVVSQPATKKRTPKRSLSETSKARVKLSYPCRSRRGMTCAVDTAWQKRGFHSLTSHTFFMGKSKYKKHCTSQVLQHM